MRAIPILPVLGRRSADGRPPDTESSEHVPVLIENVVRDEPDEWLSLRPVLDEARAVIVTSQQTRAKAGYARHQDGSVDDLAVSERVHAFGATAISGLPRIRRCCRTRFTICSSERSGSSRAASRRLRRNACFQPGRRRPGGRSFATATSGNRALSSFRRVAMGSKKRDKVNEPSEL